MMMPELTQEQWIAQCVARVIDRLQQRQHAELTLGLHALAAQWSIDAALRHASLCIAQTTLVFLHRLAAGLEEDPAAEVVRQAWRFGMKVTLEIDRACFGQLPVRGLTRLPLYFRTRDGLPVHLSARGVVGYADIAPLSPGYLVLAPSVLLTALARDEIAKRRLQLYRQE